MNILTKLLQQNRSIRRFIQNDRIPVEALLRWVGNCRYCASGRNAQALKYVVVHQEELQWIQLHRFYIYPVKRPLSSIHKKLISINHIALIGNKTGTICFEVNGGKFATKKQVDLLDYPFSNITADAKTQYIVYELGKLENLANTACRPVVFLDQQAPLHIKQSNFSKRTRANHVGKRIDD